MKLFLFSPKEDWIYKILQSLLTIINANYSLDMKCMNITQGRLNQKSCLLMDDTRNIKEPRML